MLAFGPEADQPGEIPLSKLPLTTRLSIQLHLSVGSGSTLAAEFGLPIAVNVGDAMNVLSIGPLMNNLGILGSPDKLSG